MLLIVEIAAGIVVGFWCWGALVRWAHKPEPLPPQRRKEVADALKDLSDKSPRRTPSGRWKWPDAKPADQQPTTPPRDEGGN